MDLGFRGVLLGEGVLERPSSHEGWTMSEWKWDPYSMTASLQPSHSKASASSWVSGGQLSAKESPTTATFQSDPQGQASKEFASEVMHSMSTSQPASVPSDYSLGDESEKAGQDDLQDLSAGKSKISPLNLFCQVEGCGRSLVNLSMYHQRSRICEVHLKLPSFIRAGKHQRFCQQCGRCHELTAFEGTKRSCKVQLNKHNARRRRRQKEKGGVGLAGMLKRELQSVNMETSLGSASSDTKGARAMLGLCPPDGIPDGSPALPLTPTPSLRPMFPSAQSNVSDTEFQALSSLSFKPGAGVPAMPDLLPCAPPEQALLQTDVGQFGAFTSAHLEAGLGLPHLPDLSSNEQGLPGGPLAAETSFEIAKRIMHTPNGPPLCSMQHIPPPDAPAAAWTPEAGFMADHRNLRLWMKLFDVRPDKLPLELRTQIVSWLSAAPLQVAGYLRKGCVHITVDMLVSLDVYDKSEEEGVIGLAQYLQGLPSAVWHEGHILLSVHDQVAFLKDGQILAVYKGPTKEPLPQAMPPVPIVEALMPRMVVGSPTFGARFDMVGRNILCGEAEVLVRFQGYQALTQIVSPERCCPRTARRCDSCLQVATVAVAPGLVPGVAWVEIQRGPLLGPARPLLVLPNDEFAEDVEVLIDGLVRRGASASQIDDFIVSLGCVLAADFHKSRALSKEEQDMLSKLLATAISAGLPELATHLLYVGSQGRMSAQRILQTSQAVERMCGSSVLHLAVQSREPTMLDAVIGWAKQNNFCWKLLWKGRGGLTPLHLAAMQDDGGATALKLVKTCNPGPAAWFSAPADDGATPAGFATRLGRHRLNIRMAQMVTVIPAPGVPDQRLCKSQIVPTETCFCAEWSDHSAAGSEDCSGDDSEATDDTAQSTKSAKREGPRQRRGGAVCAPCDDMCSLLLARTLPEVLGTKRSREATPARECRSEVSGKGSDSVGSTDKSSPCPSGSFGSGLQQTASDGAGPQPEPRKPAAEGHGPACQGWNLASGNAVCAWQRDVSFGQAEEGGNLVSTHHQYREPLRGGSYAF